MCCFFVKNTDVALPDSYRKCLEMAVGRYAVASAGHDVGNIYIIVGIDQSGRVLLCDGKQRGITKPKAKSLRHVRIIDGRDEYIANRILNGEAVYNADIIRSINSIKQSCPT